MGENASTKWYFVRERDDEAAEKHRQRRIDEMASRRRKPMKQPTDRGKNATIKWR